MTSASVVEPVRFSNAMVWLIVSYAIATPSLLVINAMAARLLGTEGFASFVLVITGTTLASQVGLLGLHALAVRDGADLRRGMSHDQRTLHSALIRTATRLLLPGAGLACGVLLALSQGAGSSVELVAVVALAALLTWVGGQQRLFANYLRGLGDVTVSSFLEGRAGGALMLGPQAAALFALFLVEGRDASLSTVVLVATAAAVPASLLGRIRFTFLVGRTRGRWRPWRDLGLTLRRTRGFSGLQIGMFLDTMVDLFVAATLLSAVEASSFAAAHRLAALLLVPSGLVAMVIGPMLARNRKDREGLDSVVRAGASMALATSAVLALPLAIAPTQIGTTLFGAAFYLEPNVMRVLVAAAVLRAATNLGSVTLSMTGHEGLASRVWWGGLTARLVACLGAAGLGGSLSIAVTSLGVTVLVQAALVLSARRLTGATPLPTPRPRLRQLLRTEV